jgi:hypothetical protein
MIAEVVFVNCYNFYPIWYFKNEFFQDIRIYRLHGAGAERNIFGSATLENIYIYIFYI